MISTITIFSHLNICILFAMLYYKVPKGKICSDISWPLANRLSQTGWAPCTYRHSVCFPNTQMHGNNLDVIQPSYQCQKCHIPSWCIKLKHTLHSLLVIIGKKSYIVRFTFENLLEKCHIVEVFHVIFQ